MATPQSVCRGVFDCVCVRQSETTLSSFNDGSQNRSPFNTPSVFNSTSSPYDDAVADMTSDFNTSRNIMIGVFGGLVALALVVSFCSWCRRSHSRSRTKNSTLWTLSLSLSSPIGPPSPLTLRQTAPAYAYPIESSQRPEYVISSPGEQHFGRTMNGLSADNPFSSIPYAQAVDASPVPQSADSTSCTLLGTHLGDMTPSAPPFESSSSASAPASTTC